ncbi:protein of unknown function [Pseudomonas sp. JV241A]|nr:protein of unknown function [Pseudomonas sp. JV241A]
MNKRRCGRRRGSWTCRPYDAQAKTVGHRLVLAVGSQLMRAALGEASDELGLDKSGTKRHPPRLLPARLTCQGDSHARPATCRRRLRVPRSYLAEVRR